LWIFSRMVVVPKPMRPKGPGFASFCSSMLYPPI
jgi:hypothetical protein